MAILDETAARSCQQQMGNVDVDNHYILSIPEGDARCLVAASIFASWAGGGKRPKHSSSHVDGWGAGYNTRTAYVNAYVYLRSRNGCWTSKQNIKDWHRSLNVTADFQIDTHFGSLAGKNSDNMKYVNNGWLETNENGEVRATEEGIRVYEDALAQNHGTGW